jgi:NAD(P)-dependent dehydrogenase (short-subunit alcohol dehydrogenase family)
VRAALVTGASSGIGLAIARTLGEDRYGVTVCARRMEKLERAAEGLRAAGIDAAPVAASVARAEEVEAVVRAHRERFGTLDVLVNNAGYGGPTGPLERLESRRLDLLLRVNLRAAWIAIRESEQMLRAAGAEHGKALVVNTASVAAPTSSSSSR